MYVVTFYSFKGGVGRTMCLVNVATQLARSGKKVLIVDFDLEAPGIPTFELTAPKTDTPGLIEYITEYRVTGVAPNVDRFIYSANQYESGGNIIVMPAGLHDSSYSARLNSIDWGRLYDEEDGYVFFEDLRHQWNNVISPDYILIDSRTGHSDVEGICTRQLPDAICFLFFPNEQNLQGLKKVVSNARAHNTSKKSSRESIALHFVVSNVPDLDDEEGIIGKTLERFKEQLGYSKLSGQIHHYDSLSLLNQEIFSESRPNSRLAREYKELAETIVKDNISDRDAALAFLKQTARELRSPGARERYSIPIERVEKILALFPSDVSISLQVALVYEAIGRVSDALNLLSSDATPGSARHFAIRARLNHRLGKRDEAASDMRLMLQSGDAEVPSLLEALSFASQVYPALFDDLPNSVAIKSLSDEDRVFVARQIEDGRVELPAKAAILESIYANKSDDELVGHQLALVSIGLGRFDRAMGLLSPDQSRPRELDLADTFNLAMAKLGTTLKPDAELFTRVLDLEAQQPKRDVGLNYLACMAIANAAVGRIEVARELIARCRATLQARPRREFSPWTYTKVSSKEFMEHLLDLERQLGSNELVPAFAVANQAAV